MGIRFLLEYNAWEFNLRKFSDLYALTIKIK